MMRQRPRPDMTLSEAGHWRLCCTRGQSTPNTSCAFLPVPLEITSVRQSPCQGEGSPNSCGAVVSALVARKTARSRVDAINQFVAPAEPAVEYPTEILQLCSSPVVSEHRIDCKAACPNGALRQVAYCADGSTALAVRLHSAVHLLNLAPDGSYTASKPLCPVKIVPVGSITPGDTGGNRIVDMALDPNSWAKVVLVDECGGVWSWQEFKVEIRERLEKQMVLWVWRVTGQPSFC